jgi:predicted glycoside hydrolase/deacetylase ChbG (UPF0249 family)
MAGLILTSDDFGMSIVWNKWMLEMLRSNLLSSVSIMVDRVTSDQENQINELLEMDVLNNFSLGLHLEIADKNYERDCQRQWNKFVRLLKRQPDYVDIHKGHLHKDKFDTVAELCLQKNVSFRKYNETAVNADSPKESLIATFLKWDEIKQWIDQLKNGSTYELVFHIGIFDPENNSSLNQGRVLDVENLILVNQYIDDKNITIVNFKNADF